MPNSRVNDLAAQMATINTRNLTEDEQYEIETWQKGRALAHVVNSPGWEVVIELLHSYAEKETKRLLGTDPGDKEAVLAAHATAYAAERIFTLFVEDAQNLVFSSMTPPPIVRDTPSPVPPESREL